ncbi:MAG: hypothetical protein PHS95_01960 [Candidatus Pacebacteria bacterium]|nr:hypothetical protein [Candidatus Paceibacterota bacterium]
MANNSLKFSFIPKSSFGQEESFIGRKRPRSIIEFIASVCFVLSIGLFAGLYLYNISVTKQVSNKQKEIDATEVYDQAGIDKATSFRTRVELAQTLLNAHLAVSPIFNFLTQNSLNSIYYSDFSFKKEADNWVLDLTGEAPSYSSLAYQTDVLQKNITENNKKELSSFELSNVTLTKFGTVAFALKVTFTPRYLSYTRTLYTPPEPSGASSSVDNATSTSPSVTASTETSGSDSKIVPVSH